MYNLLITAQNYTHFKLFIEQIAHEETCHRELVIAEAGLYCYFIDTGETHRWPTMFGQTEWSFQIYQLSLSSTSPAELPDG